MPKPLWPALAALGLLTLTGCGSPTGRPPQKVKAAPLAREVFVQSIDTVSTLEATDEIELAAQAGGRIQRVLVQSGQSVQAGQLLLVLDQTQLKADVSALKAQSKSDQLAYERFAGLVKEGAATALQRDEFEAKAIGSNQALRAKLADLSYKDVRAPIAGVISDLSVKAGDVLQAGSPFSRIIRNEALQARIDVPAAQANRLASGQLVQLLDGQGQRPIAKGRVTMIDPNINPSSQTLLAKAKVDNPNGMLRDGQRLRTRLIIGAERQLAVPFEAVTRQFGQSFVFVVGTPADWKKDPGKTPLARIERLPADSTVALQRSVRLGPLQGDRYPVLSGLSPTDRVILSNRSGLRHGSPIQLK